MPLEELQKSIEQDAKSTAAKLNDEGDKESERIISAAKDAAAALKKASKEKMAAEVEQREKDAMTEIDNETSAIISAAKRDGINAQLKAFNAEIKKKLQERQKDIIKLAIKNFSDVAPLKQAFVKIDRKNAPLVEDLVANIEYASIDGIVICSQDRKITADATVDGLIGSNGDVARRILAKGMYK